MMEDWLVMEGLVVGENTNHRHASTTMMRELVVGDGRIWWLVKTPTTDTRAHPPWFLSPQTTMAFTIVYFPQITAIKRMVCGDTNHGGRR